jgi:HYR domain
VKRRHPRRSRPLALLVVAGAALAAVLAAPAAAVQLGPFSGDVSQSNTAHANVLSVSTASTCVTPAGAPTVATDAVTRKYLAYTFTNTTGSDACVTVNTTVTSGNVFFAAYLGSFNPNDLAQNFVGSQANAAGCGGATSGSFAFQVPAGGSFVIVAEECTPGSGGAFSFTVDIDPISLTCPDNITTTAAAGATTASVAFAATTNGGGTPVYTISGSTTITSPYAFPIGTTNVTATLSGSQCSFDVTVNAATAVAFRGALATRTPAGVRVRWTVASSVGFVGFNVYRQTARARVRVNTRLVPGSRRTYSFLDRGAPRAGALRYWIQAVGLDGTRTWYGPVRVRRSA